MRSELGGSDIVYAVFAVRTYYSFPTYVAIIVFCGALGLVGLSQSSPKKKPKPKTLREQYYPRSRKR